jgi:hypothetical protein
MEEPEIVTSYRVLARNMYVTGVGGIFDIMEKTGRGYEEIRLALSEGGVTLVTGGPHDTATCRHDHSLAHEHARGRSCCRVFARPRTARQRRALSLAGGTTHA